MLMAKTPKEILTTWMVLVNAGDAEKLLGLYHEKASLIPTFSNRLLGTPEGVRDYFERLCGREDLSIALHEKTVMEQWAGGTLYSLCGIYCWRFRVEGEMLNFEARFSYLIDTAQERPILQHHSSQIPRML